jgi:hypothetical protein
MVNGQLSSSESDEMGVVSDSESPVSRFSSKFSCRKKHTVLIIGNSHTRNCAAKVKTDIMDYFKIQGFVKPGAGTDILVNSTTSNIMNLTKSDVLIFCGGANTVRKNNSR